MARQRGQQLADRVQEFRPRAAPAAAQAQQQAEAAEQDAATAAERDGVAEKTASAADQAHAAVTAALQELESEAPSRRR